MSYDNALLKKGLQLEIITVIWMIIETILAVGGGILAGSALLTAFGIDSLIELFSGSILLWRLWVEIKHGDIKKTEQAEHRATWFVAISLALLCLYVLSTSIYGLLVQSKPENSLVGIGVSLAAIIVMPFLAYQKRKIATIIKSEALEGDAVNSITCAYMAGTVLIGLLLNALFHWWWAEYITALVFLFWLGRETKEAFEEAMKRK